MVVAPITWSSPRESAGFKMLAASIVSRPPLLPISTSEWISSIIRMIFPLASLTSSTTFLSLSSNSPRRLVPARSPAKSKWTIRFPRRNSGTSSQAMRWAKPSAIAVLPTPGSPMSTGLFFCRRAKIWMVLSNSSARPTIGSMPPSSATVVRSWPHSSSIADLLLSGRCHLGAPATSLSSWFSFSSAIMYAASVEGSTPSFFNSLVAFPLRSWIKAKRM
mmetsp:Transcript_139464/g.353690  ORF Transcript_139464/g.353690 Transcript_139464/m.353690 type:complete len:219 (-) Transcript_139464:924-1580(-)